MNSVTPKRGAAHGAAAGSRARRGRGARTRRRAARQRRRPAPPGPAAGRVRQGGPGDSCPPDAALAVTLQELSGPDWRCAGATDDELAGLLGRWQAVESWAAAGKLGVVRELIRRRA